MDYVIQLVPGETVSVGPFCMVIFHTSNTAETHSDHIKFKSIM